ncbi:endonuclease/exonuclease/phosphatase family protein [Brevundimonas sp.]|jgi:endonuclease/exonuclease/phosphatase (EEP) superfamily protein YafD|uniref:endonuclease/exonuclease/phosphatase family protein n=1 Tax=Brevundimonas sp. TaxID=1871086 RepID=UPI001A1B85EB|nr:endonuclease/exonuclease/phosphatase family protein [Brevundimonas sp.]MBJ7510846.1 endonuclease/exonuclease/phosphatase family protein [Brevundimonas sp.]
MSLLKTAANAAAGLVLLGLATVGAAALSGVGHRWVDILAQFTAPALLAASGVTLACLILRLWPAAGLGLASVLVLAIAVWPQWAPPQGRAAPGQPVVRLYSANLWVENTDVAAMKRSIAAADADILVLIEVGDAASDHLDDLLAGYPHRAVMGAAEAPGGRALSVVASRYPILRRLPASRDGLSAVGAVVETPLGPINVFGVHLTRPWPYQYQWGQITQAMALDARRRAAPPHPVIAAGDFNSVSSARIGRQIKTDMGLLPAPGFPGTWPSALPAFAGIAIDQVYRSPDLALLSRRIGEPTGSDHYPVVTEFTRATP